MKLSEVLTALFALSAEERGELSTEDREKIAEALGFELADSQKIAELERLQDEKKDLRETVKTLSAEVETLRTESHTRRREEVIEAALSDGRILPKDKESWIARFDKNPEFTTEVIADLPRAIDYNQHGTSRGIEAEIPEDIVKLAQEKGLDPAEAQASIDATK